MNLKTAYEIYDKMIQIRMVEESIVKEYSLQEIRTPVHLYIGQEAIASAVSTNLTREDFIMSNHRSHGHCLAKGMDLEGFFKELYGKQGGVTRGWGGSMHLCDMSLGIAGTSAIVAGGIPIGAGIALKQKIKGEKNITVIYFGDGAVDEGVFWETVNFSALMRLPVFFVMENNKYASQTSEVLRHSYKDVTKIIKNFGIPAYQVDGNDAVRVYETSRKIIKKIREGFGPHFIECGTFRMMGHVGVSDDTDTGYRTREEYDYWKSRCPIKLMENYLRQRDTKSADNKIWHIKRKWSINIKNALSNAKEARYALD